MDNNASGKKGGRELIFESPERRAHNLLMFCRVITAQVDYIVALGDKDNLHNAGERDTIM